MMKRILIFRGGAIGDFVLTTPVFAAVRQHWQDTHVELVGYPRIAELALAAGLIDGFASLDRAEIATLFSPESRMPRKLADHIGSFDAVLSYLHDPDGAVERNLLTTGARCVIAASPQVRSGHAVDHLLSPLKRLGIATHDGTAPRICFGDRCLARGRELLQNVAELALLIHPGSGSARKNWPPERFAELVRLIREKTPFMPAFIGGEADAAVIEILRRLSPDTPCLAGHGLLDVATMLACCVGYVGNDSGITHLAAATGIPVVALFGLTDPDAWGPRGENVRIIRANEPTSQGFAAIEPGEVFDQLVAGVRTGPSDRR